MPSHHPRNFQIILDRIAVQWSIVVIQTPYLGKLQMWQDIRQGREKDLLNIQTEGLARRARLELRRTDKIDADACQMLPIDTYSGCTLRFRKMSKVSM